jgi:hypothetical protein
MADHQRQIAAACSFRSPHDMGDHRQAGDRMQHFWHSAFHACAFAGGEDDGQAGSLAHGMATI